MATNFRFNPTSAGLLLSEEFRCQCGRRGELQVELDRDEVRDIVALMCRNAGLPEPWNGLTS